jgi:hypothetical protein
VIKGRNPVTKEDTIQTDSWAVSNGDEAASGPSPWAHIYPLSALVTAHRQLFDTTEVKTHALLLFKLSILYSIFHT